MRARHSLYNFGWFTDFGCLFNVILGVVEVSMFMLFVRFVLLSVCMFVELCGSCCFLLLKSVRLPLFVCLIHVMRDVRARFSFLFLLCLHFALEAFVGVLCLCVLWSQH